VMNEKDCGAAQGVGAARVSSEADFTDDGARPGHVVNQIRRPRWTRWGARAPGAHESPTDVRAGGASDTEGRYSFNPEVRDHLVQKYENEALALQDTISRYREILGGDHPQVFPVLEARRQAWAKGAALLRATESDRMKEALELLSRYERENEGDFQIAVIYGLMADMIRLAAVSADTCLWVRILDSMAI
jgi:hypothetical protein